ncbi:unnamed protein product [Polarella glacialis]|uniref:Uncharacterized protein n=1 Tax=Polarella glacialis TaxID=89957 RepID=A0A813L8S1_POLGL|nr:unnamed protein product [Polarella glacialis]
MSGRGTSATAGLGRLGKSVRGFSATLTSSKMSSSASANNHLALRGGGPKGVSWTKVAEPYPWGFAELLALLCADRAGWKSLPEDFSVSEFARKSCLCHSAEYDVFRPKRAKYDPRFANSNHPFAHGFLRLCCRVVFVVVVCCCLGVVCDAAPQSRRIRVPLEDKHRVSRVIVDRNSIALGRFRAWLLGQGCEVSIDELCTKPALLDGLAHKFGQSLYNADKPYSHYVYLLTGLQSTHLYLKRQLQYSWNFAFIWCDAEPSVHRTPGAEVVVEAICSLALCFG